VLSQPPPASLFPALVFQKFKRTPSNVRFVAHSPLSFRFLCEIRRLPTERVIYLPLPVASPIARSSFSPAEKPHVLVGTLARFSSESNLHYFLNIAHYVTHKQGNAHFRILGAGTLKPHLQTIVRDLGMLSSVSFDEGEPRALAELDILIYSPLQNTHFLPLLLAGSRGCAVLASELPGVEQLLTDGKDGFVVPVNDTKPMAELVLRLVADPNLRHAVGERLKSSLLGKFSASVLGAEYSQRLVGTKTQFAKAA
jgi:glycosyltransferase involved in cell wall biosynthesis